MWLLCSHIIHLITCMAEVLHSGLTAVHHVMLFLYVPQVLVPQIAAAAWSSALTAAGTGPPPPSSTRTTSITADGHVDPLAWLPDTAPGANAQSCYSATEAAAARRRAHGFVQQVFATVQAMAAVCIAGEVFEAGAWVCREVAHAVAASAHVMLGRLEDLQDGSLLVDVQHASRCEHAADWCCGRCCALPGPEPDPAWLLVSQRMHAYPDDCTLLQAMPVRPHTVCVLFASSLRLRAHAHNPCSQTLVAVCVCPFLLQALRRGRRDPPCSPAVSCLPALYCLNTRSTSIACLAGHLARSHALHLSLAGYGWTATATARG